MIVKIPFDVITDYHFPRQTEVQYVECQVIKEDDTTVVVKRILDADTWSDDYITIEKALLQTEASKGGGESVFSVDPNDKESAVKGWNRDKGVVDQVGEIVSP